MNSYDIFFFFFNIIGTIIAVIIGFFAIIFILKNGFNFLKFGMNKQLINYKVHKWDNSASDANPPKERWIDGQLWTPINEFKRKSNANLKTNPVYFCNFRFKNKYLEDSKMPEFLRKSYESQKYYVSGDLLCRTTVGIGGAGSGKTEFINSIMLQNFYEKSVVFGKKFDFERWAYRKGIDFLYQPKLENSDIHNILGEDIQYIKLYIESVMNASLGKSQDYFSGSAKQKLEKFLQRVKISEKDNSLNQIQKWDLFLEFFEDELYKAHTGEQKSERDVMSTVNATIEPIRLIAYRIKNGARTFTTKDFYNNEKPIKLFLSAIDSSLEGILAATGAVFAKYQLSLPNNWSKKPVLWVLDEYNSWRRIIDNNVDIEMTELGRSKMFAVFKMLQNLPEKQEEIKNIFSNMQYLLIFSVTDLDTQKKLIEAVGKINYTYLKKNITLNGNKKSISYTEEKMSEDIISDFTIKSLQEEGFHHLFYAPKEKTLFKGYTPRVLIKEREYIDFREINLVDFYKWKDSLEKKFQERLNKNINALKKVLAS